MTDTKLCPRCKTETDDYAMMRNGKPYPYCRPCTNAYGREYYHKNTARRKAHHDAWVAKNREHWNTYSREYTAQHPEVRRESSKKWRQKNKDKYNAYQREYYHNRQAKKKAEIEG